jgi:THO complex subunit 1
MPLFQTNGYPLDDIWHLLDILQYLEDHGSYQYTKLWDAHTAHYSSDLTPPALVVWLIEELLEGQTIEGCRKVFDYIEPRRIIIISVNVFFIVLRISTLIASKRHFQGTKALVLLRACNDLLRRLSRTEDAAFCGRVFTFLFLSFPLGDRASVNRLGEFHTGNVTTFDLDGSTGDGNGTSIPIDQKRDLDETFKAVGHEQPAKLQNQDQTDESAKDDDQNFQNLDRLYPVFWSLQQIYSNPPLIFRDDNYAKFKTSLQATLAKFRVVPKIIPVSTVTTKSDERGGFESSFNPKYLTSRDLFKLEVKQPILWITLDANRSIVERRRLPAPRTRPSAYPY